MRASISLLVAVVLTLPGVACAWSTDSLEYHWSTDHIVFNLHPNLSATGTRLSAIRRAMQSWDSVRVKATSLMIEDSPSQTSANPNDHFDNFNTIAMDTIGDGALAVTYRRAANNGFWMWLEADIKLSSGVTFVESSAADPGYDPLAPYVNFDLGGVVRHELGHAVGMAGHEGLRLAVMNPIYLYGVLADVGMHGDDRYGLRTRYRLSSTPCNNTWERDITVSGYKLVAQDRAARVDSPLAITHPSISPTTVVQGEEMTVEYTLENLGTRDEYGFSVGFYLSSDTNITAGDLVLDKTFVDFTEALPSAGGNCSSTDPYQPYPQARTLTYKVKIPCTVTAGAYYLGVIADCDGQIPETREDNNAMALPTTRLAAMIVVQTPGKPTNLIATDQSCEKISLSWLDAVSGPPPTRYDVFRGPDYENPIASPTVRSFDDFPPPGTYAYRVAARVGCSRGPLSNIEEGTRVDPGIQPPGTFKASDDLCGGVQLTWIPSSGATGYKVFRGGQELTTVTDPAAAGYFDATAAVGVVTTYWVFATGQGDCRSNSSNSDDGYVFPSPGVAQRPIPLPVTTQDCGGIVVRWSRSTGIPLTGYRIYRDGNIAYSHEATSVADTVWVDNSIVDNVNHTYTIRAYNQCGTTTDSDPYVAHRREAPSIAVSYMNATDAGECCEGVRVSWMFGGGDVDGVRIYRTGLSGALYDTYGAPVTSYLDEEILPGQGATYQVVPYNACGEGPGAFDAGSRCTPIEWNPAGTPIVTPLGWIESSKIVPDGAGGAFYVWSERRGGANAEADVFAQRISPDGNPCWRAGGIPLCKAPGDQYSVDISDGVDGTAYVVWQDYRSGNSDIYGTYLTLDGVPGNDSLGTAICTDFNTQGDPKICNVNFGAATAAVWSDDRDGIPHIYGRPITWQIAGGWQPSTPTSTRLTNGPAGEQVPMLVGGDGVDGEGDFLLSWVDGRPGGGAYSIFGGRVTAGLAGDMALTYETSVIPSSAAVWNVGGSAPERAMVSDGAGGQVIVWTDNRTNLSNFDLYAQRIVEGGMRQWGGGGAGIPVAVSAQQDGSPRAVLGSAGAVFVGYRTQRLGNWDIAATFLTSNGDYVWSDTTRFLCTEPSAQGDLGNFVLAGDMNGGAVAYWSDDRNMGGSDHSSILMRGITSAGERVGEYNGSLAIGGANGQVWPVAAPFSPGRLVLAYLDGRTTQGVNDGIYFLEAEPSGNAEVDLTQSFFIPEAGSVSAPLTGNGPTGATRFFRACPNNDGSSLPNNARIRVELRNASGSGIPNVPAADISIVFNGGTPAQGFQGSGADSIIANHQYNPLHNCPDVRVLTADAASDQQGTAYLTFCGATSSAPGIGVRDPSRKWGHIDSNIPVLFMNKPLPGRLNSNAANGSYVLRIRNFDVGGGIGTGLNQGEMVGVPDFNVFTNAQNGSPTFRYWCDFNEDGAVTATDFNIMAQHDGHNCDTPSNP